MTTIKINPKELSFSHWNVNTVSPENMEKLKESVRRNAFFAPSLFARLKTATK
ncbi:ParB/RepB/Spo0J family partition protein [Xanthomonas phage JGB6]|nr:ParB/RepB/Spo0J family partition protein [Xanthomonas phage JGB6]